MRPRNAILFCFAALAFTIVVVRACLQSITIDEANVALGYAINPWTVQWFPADENHVLNTMLERVSASIFPLNELTIRLPAILGAALYIGAALWFCLRLTSRKIVQLPFFICLVFNPMILDYMVAARGYSLGMGFFFLAIALIADTLLADGGGTRPNLRARCIWVSVLTALSVCSNFSFAIVNAATLLIFFLWVAAQYRKSGRAGFLSLAVSSFLPGIVLGFLLCVTAFWNPVSRLDVGTQSLADMWRVMAAASFDDLNSDLLNPRLIVWFRYIQPLMPYIWLLSFILLLAFANLRDSLTRLLAAITILTMVLHWIALETVHISLPQGRSSLFLVLLLTLLFGTMLTLRRNDRWFVMRGSMAVLILVAIYFAGCLRIGYFKEWRYDADTKQLFWIFDDLRRHCGTARFVSDWRYHSSLNFYRTVYGKYMFPEFPMAASGKLPSDRDAYALFYPTSEDFIRNQHLQLLYRSDSSGAAIAIRACEASHQASSTHLLGPLK